MDLKEIYELLPELRKRDEKLWKEYRKEKVKRILELKKEKPRPFYII